MKHYFTLFFLFFSIGVFAKHVPVDNAKLVAIHFLQANVSDGLKSTSNFNLELVSQKKIKLFSKNSRKAATDKELVYIFNITNGNGFILVSGDDGAVPILGYSSEGAYIEDNIPVNVSKWIEGYKKQIRYVTDHPEMVSQKIRDEWTGLLQNQIIGKKSGASSISPLLTTKWDQSPFYNELCPYSNAASANAVTGCAATSMAQIMNYWEYPAQGSGFHSYQHESYGLLSANFGATNYSWASMPDQVTSSNTAVATLMYHCGVSIDMDYNVETGGSSGAYVISARSPVENCVEFALKEYFGYKKTLHGVDRNNYSTSEWVNLLKNELDAGRPIEYAGFGTGGGHAFVCDGYDPNDYFHFNWGWSGNYDGYFIIDALNPEGVGIGGGEGGYNSNQQALIGIEPPADAITYDMSLYDNLTISNNTIFFGDPFTIHTDIVNNGGVNFSGDFCAAIFDANNNFVEFAGKLEGATLPGGMHYTDGLTFSNEGSITLLPGSYFAQIFYRPVNGSWMLANDGAYNNTISFSIYYSSDIEIYSDFMMTGGDEITMGEAFSVKTNIFNDGTSNFSGDFQLALFDMSGEQSAIIETLTGADLEAGYYYEDVTFSSGGISITPGTYLMALLYKPADSDWILSGSTYYSNPVKVIVKEAGLNPDIYEDNNSADAAYILDVGFANDAAEVSTTGSNIHQGTDMDFYHIVLDEGYNYSIKARVNDSYSSADDQNYTGDVIWAYYANDEESDMFDDVMDGNITINNGGDVFFAVAPFFEGETGTYLLDIQISRSEASSTREMNQSPVNVFPNPANDLLNIESGSIIESISIFDIRGSLVKSELGTTNRMALDISSLKDGMYFVHINSGKQVIIKKVIKQ